MLIASPYCGASMPAGWLERKNRQANREIEMKKVWLVGAIVITLSMAGAMAKDATEPAAKADKKGAATRELTTEEMTITGTIDKMEKKKKDGTPMMTWFRLIDEDCREVRVPKGEVEKYVGCKVKVTGQGYTLDKKGKTMRAFKTITNIEKLADAPAAPSAPSIEK